MSRDSLCYVPPCHYFSNNKPSFCSTLARIKESPSITSNIIFRFPQMLLLSRCRGSCVTAFKSRYVSKLTHFFLEQVWKQSFLFLVFFPRFKHKRFPVFQLHNPAQPLRFLSSRGTVEPAESDQHRRSGSTGGIRQESLRSRWNWERQSYRHHPVRGVQNPQAPPLLSPHIPARVRFLWELTVLRGT